MAVKYHKSYGATRRIVTPQLEAIPGREEEMVENSAGGFAFKVDPWQQLNRFLILGTEGGTYYVSEKTLTVDNAKNIIKLIKSDGVKVVETITDVSLKGKAYKQDATLFCLALAFTHGDKATKKAVVDIFPKLCRIGTHLFIFLKYVTSMRGWGRGLRELVQNWYQCKEPMQLVQQLTKYQSREGWSHRDALRTAHVKPADKKESAIYGYVVDKKKHTDWKKYKGEPFKYLQAVQKLFDDEMDVDGTVELIKEFELPREVLPTKMLTEIKVWDALLDKMPMTAMIRNLGKMSSIGLLKPLAKGNRAAEVCDRITDSEALRKARIHPIQILAALYTYQSGHGAKGNLEWQVNPRIVESLDEAFYKCFQNVEPVNKPLLIAVDVSGSMGDGEICGVPDLTPCIGAAAMAMSVARTEKNYHILGFCDHLVDLGMTAKMTLKEAARNAQRSNFGSTDCALPMKWALQEKAEVHGFVVITDNETWAGDSHPTQALAEYRRKMGIPARLAVIGMTATEISIADPNDPGQMDFVGFSTDTPSVLSDFLRGEL